MEFVNLTTGEIAWSGIYSFRKVGEGPENIERELDIQIWTDKSIYRVGENLYVHFRSSVDCYLYLYHQSPSDIWYHHTLVSVFLSIRIL